MTKTTNETKSKSAETRKRAIHSDAGKPLETPDAKLSESDPDSKNNLKADGDGPVPVQGGIPLPGKSQDISSLERIGFKVVEGKLSLDNVRESNKPRVLKVIKDSLSDPDWRKQAGLTSEAAPVKVALPPEMVGKLFDLAAMLECSYLARVTALPAQEIYPMVMLNGREHELLDSQATDLLNKYIPDEWLKYSDVGIFAMSLYTVMGRKASAVKEYAKDKLEKMGKAPTHDEPPASAAAPAPVVSQTKDWPKPKKAGIIEELDERT